MFITRERVTCAGVCYGDTEGAFEALLERLSSFFVVLLTCRFALCLFIAESKSRVKHETNPQVLFSSFVLSCADKFTGRLFWGLFKHRNSEIPKCENQIKSRSSKIMSLSEAVRGKHGVPHMGGRLDLRRWSAVTWRKNSVGFPSQPNPLRGRQKDIARPCWNHHEACSQAKEKGPQDTAYSLTPPDRAQIRMRVSKKETGTPTNKKKNKKS